MTVQIADPIHATLTHWIQTCEALVAQEMPWRGRPDPELLASMLGQILTAGATADTLRAWLRQSAEWQQHQAAPPPPPSVPSVTRPSRLTPAGRLWKDASGATCRPRWCSAFSLCTVPPAVRDAFIDWVVARGFNGVRVMVGALGWAGQSPAAAVAALPATLEALARRGLQVEVTALTGTRGTDYNPKAHLRTVAGLVANAGFGLLELANEPYHNSQAPEVNNLSMLRVWANEVVPSTVPWAIGAARVDEASATIPYPATGGSYLTAHLDRHRQPEWEMARRVRELYGLYELSHKPVLNNEPIGAAETPDRGRRSTHLGTHATLGALSRLFDVGYVFHLEDGLRCVVPGPVQTRCADAGLGAWLAVEAGAGGAELTYYNSGRSDGPVQSFTQHEATRVYSGVAGRCGVTVCVGASPKLRVEWQNGWRQAAILGTWPGADGRTLDVWRIER